MRVAVADKRRPMTLPVLAPVVPSGECSRGDACIEDLYPQRMHVAVLRITPNLRVIRVLTNGDADYQIDLGIDLNVVTWITFAWRPVYVAVDWVDAALLV